VVSRNASDGHKWGSGPYGGGTYTHDDRYDDRYAAPVSYQQVVVNNR
jgi:hypothetical protein